MRESDVHRTEKTERGITKGEERDKKKGVPKICLRGFLCSDIGA